MKLLDVNVVLPAHRDDHKDHSIARPWLDDLLVSQAQFTVPWVVCWSFLRLSSHPRIFPVPTPIDEALGFITALRAQTGHIPVDAGPLHVECLQSSCEEGEATADLIPDAVLAALAAEHGCDVVSFDRDFARFPGIRWTRPELPEV